MVVTMKMRRTRKGIRDDDKEGLNDKSKDMDKAEVSEQDTQEDIQSDGPTMDRDEILEGFCDH